jgi:hypothetical protein
MLMPSEPIAGQPALFIPVRLSVTPQEKVKIGNQIARTRVFSRSIDVSACCAAQPLTMSIFEACFRPGLADLRLSIELDETAAIRLERLLALIQFCLAQSLCHDLTPFDLFEGLSYFCLELSEPASAPRVMCLPARLIAAVVGAAIYQTRSLFHQFDGSLVWRQTLSHDTILSCFARYDMGLGTCGTWDRILFRYSPPTH